MFSYSSQGQESNGYFQEKELPIQLCVTKAEGEKIKNVKLFSKFVLYHQIHKIYPQFQHYDLRSTSACSFILTDIITVLKQPHSQQGSEIVTLFCSTLCANKLSLYTEKGNKGLARVRSQIGRAHV